MSDPSDLPVIPDQREDDLSYIEHHEKSQLNASPNPENASLFLRFMTSDRACDIYRNHGFLIGA